MVTIITPCYRAGDTLALALASLITQTVGDWECIVIDDGSKEPIKAIVDEFDDPRFRHHRFDDNRGRPVARQKALEMARGRFICMLDADDWYYPDKLASQLEMMKSRPELSALAMSMAVFNDGRLTGVRPFGDSDLEVHRADGRYPPNISFPTVMLRRKTALSHSFDPRLRRAEDPDYLRRALAGAKYGVMSKVGYAYRETWSMEAMNEALAAFRYERMSCTRHFTSAPLAMARHYGRNLIKTAVYSIARTAGGGKWLFDRRNRAPSANERHTFFRNRRLVTQQLDAVVAATTKDTP